MGRQLLSRRWIHCPESTATLAFLCLVAWSVQQPLPLRWHGPNASPLAYTLSPRSQPQPRKTLVGASLRGPSSRVAGRCQGGGRDGRGKATSEPPSAFVADLSGQGGQGYVGAQILCLGLVFLPLEMGEPVGFIPEGLAPAGEALADAGLAFCLWAVFLLAPRLRQPGSPLIREGPFALVRHPMYSGFLAMAAGICLSSPNPLRLVAAVALTFVLKSKVEDEEKSLAEERGEEWQAYCAEVPSKILPFLS